MLNYLLTESPKFNWKIEIFGIIAGILILLSFVFRKEYLIRAINLVGAIFFVTYGIILKAHSVYVINGILALMQIGFLIFLLVKKLKKSDSDKKLFNDLIDEFSKNEKISSDKELSAKINELKNAHEIELNNKK